MNSRDLLALLGRDGWTVQRVRGSHHVLRHPSKPGHVVVPHPRKALGTGLVRAILRQASMEVETR